VLVCVVLVDCCMCVFGATWREVNIETGGPYRRSIPEAHHRFLMMEIRNGPQVPEDPMALRYGPPVWASGFDIFWANQNAPRDET
jgi:hypothetical protein